MDITVKNVCTFPTSSSNGHQIYTDKVFQEDDVSIKDIEQTQHSKNITPMSTNKLQVIVPDGTIIDIKVHNILCNYTLPMHIDLRLLAYHSINVDYDRFKGVLIKQLRNPECTVKIFNSGKIVIMRCKSCTFLTLSEAECKRAARQIGRMIQRGMDKLDQRICIKKYRVSNIFATCRLPFAVRVEEVARKYRGEGAKYEPELMSGLEWVLVEPKSFLRIYTTGAIIISGATSELDLIKSVERVYPFLKEFSYQKNAETGKNIEDETQFFLPYSNTSRRRPRQQTSSLSQKNNGILATKKGRYVDRVEVLGTGIYNNQMYWEDEVFYFLFIFSLF